MGMTLRALGIALAVGLTSTAVAGYAKEPAPAPGSEATAKPDKSKKVCRTIVKTGTRFGERHCRSIGDWDKDAENASRYLEDSQMYGYSRDGVNTAANGSGVTPPR